jgi:hypothetical protein
MKAKELDKKFDAGQSIINELSLKKARRPGYEQKRVNVDFPAWIIGGLDHQAERLGTTRQAVIKMWIAERLEQLH